MKKFLLILCIIFNSTISYSKENSSMRSDWKSHIIKSKSGLTNKTYNLELIELEGNDDAESILLLIPGYFQNAYSFDLMPEKNISVMRYLAEKLKVKIFVLHPNGIGKSEYVKKSLIDDIAIDDIDTAVKFLKKLRKKLYTMAHSNGAIALQAYLGGLDRSGRGNIFDEEVADLRQKQFQAVAISAGNVCMTDTRNLKVYDFAKNTGRKLQGLIKHLGWINGEILTKILSPTKIFGKRSIAYSKLWQFLYNRENVSKDAMKALFDLTIEGTSARSLVQYIEAINSECIHSSGGDPYFRGLFNIELPIIQLTYEVDSLADPTATKRDNFARYSSKNKKFFMFPNQGHEDFMMSAIEQENLKEVVKFFQSI